jgi:hypothetical protein
MGQLQDSAAELKKIYIFFLLLGPVLVLATWTFFLSIKLYYKGYFSKQKQKQESSKSGLTK